MSRNFKYTFCENYYLTLNRLSQHLKRCKQTFYSSTEESNEEVSEIISDINDMSLDNEEFQSVLEGLPSSFKTRKNPSQDLYEFEECEEYDEVLQSQSNEELRNSEFFEELAKVLSIILYSDTTTFDTLGKKDAKQLLGYFPIISAKDKTEKKSSEFKILVRKTFYNSIKFLLESLFENANIDLKIDDKRIWFYPRISTVICDWPEACTFSLTYKSSNSNYPCHFCLVSKDNLANTCLRKSQAVLRNKENMKKYYDNDITKEVSLEPVYNYFWDIPDLNIYNATVPDRIHHLDLGLYHYQIEFTKELLSKSSINKFNRRIAEIPRHPSLKIFAGGLQSIARLTANEFRDLMKIMVFVVDDLHNKDLSEVYVKWNEMYLLKQIAELNRIIIEIAALYRQKIQYIVDQTPEDQDPLWKLSDLEELRKICEQLKLLFQIKDSI
ncbi:hypothetical protein Glove_320g207 [Diversispora epigaea]|uniref:Uncharacterized protein n=1 Tax=Diversispora epigaea TaxID=1348612 RepID=A0A397HUF1_9GLOM|nr:hypothetical protein Glove_320g207 [Diversispora epigaea]